MKSLRNGLVLEVDINNGPRMEETPFLLRFSFHFIVFPLQTFSNYSEGNLEDL